MKIESKKIGRFIKSLNDAEFIYLKHTVDISEAIRHLIKRHKLSKAQVCEFFKTTPNKYNDIVKGNFNYSLHEIACLNVAQVTLETKKIQDDVLDGKKIVKNANYES